MTLVFLSTRMDIRRTPPSSLRPRSSWPHRPGPKPRRLAGPNSRESPCPARRWFLGGSDDAFGDRVALHDPAEDVDEDALHRRIGEDDLECRGDLLGGGAAPDVEE